MTKTTSNHISIQIETFLSEPAHTLLQATGEPHGSALAAQSRGKRSQQASEVVKAKFIPWRLRNFPRIAGGFLITCIAPASQLHALSAQNAGLWSGS